MNVRIHNLVSSANIIGSSTEDAFLTSLTYNKNSRGPKLLKTITSDFVYGKPPPTTFDFLEVKLYNQSGDVAAFAK